MKGFREAELCLALETARSKPLQKLWITQTKYPFFALKRSRMESCHPLHIHWMTTNRAETGS